LRQATDVSLPAQNTLGDALTFDYIATPSPSETRHRVTYQRVGTGPYYVQRREIQVINLSGVWTETGTPIVTRVTEEIGTLAALHFIHRGSRVVTILVAQYEAGGTTRTISYTLQTSVRTLFNVVTSP
jgi:hypothetical protein